LDNGTFLRDGTKFIMRNQSRLLPGAYVRQKENGEYEAHINADMREGAIHHYGLEPETGVMNVIVSGSKTPIYGLARALGATDEEMEAAWGKELTDINKKKFQTSQISKLYDKLAREKKTAKNDEEKIEAIRSSLEKINFDPEVMEITLGKPYKNMNKDVLLTATKKLLSISRGEAESDDVEQFWQDFEVHCQKHGTTVNKVIFLCTTQSRNIINPYHFFTEHIGRYHYTLLAIEYRPYPTDLTLDKIPLRRLIPPWSTLLIQQKSSIGLEISIAGESIDGIDFGSIAVMEGSFGTRG